MDIMAVFRESFNILKQEPKLFLPKLLLALLYGIGIVLATSLILDVLPIVASGEMDLQSARLITQSIPLVIAYFFYTVFVFATEVLINSMYPVMVRDFRAGKRVSFRTAFSFAAKRFFVVFLAMFAIELAIAVPFALVSTILLLNQNMIALGVAVAAFLAISFLLILLFYTIYPVAVLQEKGFFSTLSKTISLGKSNIRELSIPAMIPFSLSLASFLLSIEVSNPGVLVLFIIVRFLVAMVATYHMVLNPNIYFALEGGSS